MKTLLTLQLTIFILVAVGFLMKKIHIIGPPGQQWCFPWQHVAAQITAVPMQKTEAQQQRQQKHLTVIHWLWQPTQHSRHMSM